MVRLASPKGNKMGFCREPIAEYLSTETRRESFKIHASYPWGQKSAAGYPDQHIEIPYTDLPALVKELTAIMHEECGIDDPTSPNQKEQHVQMSAYFTLEPREDIHALIVRADDAGKNYLATVPWATMQDVLAIAMENSAFDFIDPTRDLNAPNCSGMAIVAAGQVRDDWHNLLDVMGYNGMVFYDLDGRNALIPSMEMLRRDGYAVLKGEYLVNIRARRGTPQREGNA